MASNFAPNCQWFELAMVRGRRTRLYVDDRETPFFIARRVEKHDLYGSGMSKSGSAAHIDSCTRIADLKHKAEQLAFAA